MSTQRDLGHATSDSISLAQGTGLASLWAALFLRAGRPFCYSCGLAHDDAVIEREALSLLQSSASQEQFSLRAPLLDTGEALEERLSEMRAEGWSVLWLDGEAIALSEAKGIVLGESTSIEIASWKTPSDDSEAYIEALQQALRIGRGCVSLHWDDGRSTVLGHTDCQYCGLERTLVGEALLSLGSEQARCVQCAGQGLEKLIDPELLVRDSTLTLSEGAITPWHEKNTTFFGGLLQDICDRSGISMQTSWCELPLSARELLLLGAEESDFGGIVHDMQRRLEAALSPRAVDREWVFSYCSSHACGRCGGSGWSEQAESVRLGDLSIVQVYSTPIGLLPALLAGVRASIPDKGELNAIVDELTLCLSRLQPLFPLYLGARAGELTEAGKNWLSEYRRGD